MGDFCADFREFCGILQEIHHFLQFGLFFIGTSHVGKGDLLSVGHAQGGAGLAEIVQGIAVVGPACHKAVHNEQHQSRQNQRQHQIIGGSILLGAQVVVFQHTGGGLLGDQFVHLAEEPVRVRQSGGNDGLTVIGGVQSQGDHVVILVDDEGLHLFLPEQLQNFGIGNLVLALVKQAACPGKYQHEQRQIKDQGYGSTIFQLGSPYFVYTSGFRMPT